MTNFTLEPEICLICREEDELKNLLNYHFDPLNNIKHLIYSGCADAVDDRNCPFCRQPAFSVIKRSGVVEVDKLELQKYFDRLVQLLKKSEKASARLSSIFERIIVNDLENDSIEIKNFSKQTRVKLFRDACKVGNIKIVKYMNEIGSDNHAKDDDALYTSAENGHLKGVKYLVDHGANIHADSDDTLRSSAEYGHLDIVKYLVEQGVNINANNDDTIQWAAYNGHLDIVKYLVVHGADIHAKNDGPLRFSAQEGHLDIVTYLVKHGADIHAANCEALREAAYNGFFEVANFTGKFNKVMFKISFIVAQ